MRMNGIIFKYKVLYLVSEEEHFEKFWYFTARDSYVFLNLPLFNANKHFSRTNHALHEEPNKLLFIAGHLNLKMTEYMMMSLMKSF
jgi:hypothetical protein